MVEFAGYAMPVQYQSVIAEAKVVRSGAGMFDVSHMARLRFRGSRVLEYLEWVTTNDVSKLVDGGGQYSLLPNSRGGLVDDIIVYRDGAEAFRMVVNASNHEKDVAHLRGENRFGVEMEDETEGTAMIAVQGPLAVEKVAGLSEDGERLRRLAFFGTAEARVAGVGCFVARSGYTGEDGFELVCAGDRAAKLWGALAEAGVASCGLGSRDTLRVEAGLPLYGHELDEETSPLEAGLGWVISKAKSFLGSDEVNRVRAEGPRRRLQGILMDGRRIPGQGMGVSLDGAGLGVVSSGVYSPLLERGIGFAFLAPSAKVGERVLVDVRGSGEGAVVASKRFYQRG